MFLDLRQRINIYQRCGPRVAQASDKRTGSPLVTSNCFSERHEWAWKAFLPQVPPHVGKELRKSDFLTLRDFWVSARPRRETGQNYFRWKYRAHLRSGLGQAGLKQKQFFGPRIDQMGHLDRKRR